MKNPRYVGIRNVKHRIWNYIGVWMFLRPTVNAFHPGKGAAIIDNSIARATIMREKE